jgi:F-box-like
MSLTRRQKQLQAQSTFKLSQEELARVFSHLDLRSLVCTAAVASKRWREVAATQPLAWTTAVAELDPLAVLGPAGVKAAAQTLQRCGGWLKLAARLGNKRCAHSSACEHLGLYFDRAKLRRVCSQHKARATGQVPFLLNGFLYDTYVSYEVQTAAELERAVDATRVGQCIRVICHITLDNDTAPFIYNRRLIGPAREAGQAPQASITLVRTPLLTTDTIIQDLRIVTGDNGEYDMYFWDVEPDFFPGIQVCEKGGVLMYNCNVVARQVCNRTILL